MPWHCTHNLIKKAGRRSPTAGGIKEWERGGETPIFYHYQLMYFNIMFKDIHAGLRRTASALLSPPHACHREGVGQTHHALSTFSPARMEIFFN